MIAFCRTARTAKEMIDYLGLKDRKHFKTEVLNPLINQKKLAMKFPDKHGSPKQKYYSPNISPSKTV
ncbi:Fic family protein [Desulfosarcina sp. BuS5]|uniref:Fic family protein n=2 Tax=Desulfosarcina sp. BuS5 TaxID=933262 RepID=UPI00350F646F